MCGSTSVWVALLWHFNAFFWHSYSLTEPQCAHCRPFAALLTDTDRNTDVASAVLQRLVRAAAGGGTGKIQTKILTSALFFHSPCVSRRLPDPARIRIH